MLACDKFSKLGLPIYRISKTKTCITNSVSRRLISKSKRALSISTKPLGDRCIFPSIYPDITIPDVSITQLIFDSQEKYADKICLINGETEQTWTHGEIRSSILRLASAFSRLGIGKGATVALISPNCPEFAIVFFAVIHLGATVSTINSTYTHAEINHQLKNSDSHFVVCHEDKLADVILASKDIQEIRKIMCIGKETGGIVSIQKLLKDDDGKGIPNIQINPAEDVTVLPYSSGTTGLPKGVMLTHANIVANILQALHPNVTFMQNATVDYQEKMIGLLPLFHVYGMVCCMCHSLVAGSQLITFKNFNQERFTTALSKYQVTKLHVVPPLVNFLNTSEMVKESSLSSVSHIMCGAAPLGRSLIDSFFNKFGNAVRFVEGYGMTEASPITHVSVRDNFIIGSCGAALPNTFTKIVDLDTRQPLNFGVEGELCVKGPQVMKGYYKNEKATGETVDPEGWLHTGDIARMDRDGNVFIVDRLKELIKVKGLQVAPAELENLLRQHPALEDVAVTSVPDERAGELPRAFVVSTAGQSITEKEIKDFVAARVARHKRLDGGVVFVKEIPKSAAGKILRRQLKKMG